MFKFKQTYATLFINKTLFNSLFKGKKIKKKKNIEVQVKVNKIMYINFIYLYTCTYFLVSHQDFFFFCNITRQDEIIAGDLPKQSQVGYIKIYLNFLNFFFYENKFRIYDPGTWSGYCNFI